MACISRIYRNFDIFIVNIAFNKAKTMKIHNLNVKKSKKPCGLHSCLRHTLRLGRWAGFFPVQGLGQVHVDGIRFKIKSIYSCYLVTTIIGQAVMVGFSVVFFCDNEVSLPTISNMIFYTTGLISSIILLKLARQWPTLMATAAETEQSLSEIEIDKRAIVKTSVVAYVGMALALVEHILCLNFNMKFIMNCLHENEISTNVMENFAIHRMPYVFNYLPYSLVNAILTEFMGIQATFLWSYNDVLIICFSIYITSYFRKLNRLIAINTKKDKDKVSWATLREHYSNLVKLVREIDEQVSSFVLLSFFTDLFYICLQLFNSLHRSNVSSKECDELETKLSLSSPEYLLYYLYSFLFLVLRALMVSLFAANVHCAAQEPIYFIYEIPAAAYDNEVRRFQLQLHHSEIGLSGKFFNVTRNMVLKVIGTIITYEIVLFQYSGSPQTSSTSSIVIDNITQLNGQQ